MYLTNATKFVAASIFFSVFATADDPNSSATQTKQAYPFLANENTDLSSKFNSSLLGGLDDRLFQCNAEAANVGPRAADCLDILLSMPGDGNLFDFEPRYINGVENKQGFVPTGLIVRKCVMKFEFVNDHVSKERTSWLMLQLYGVAIVNLCKRGSETRVVGQVIFGEKGLLKLSFAKATREDYMKYQTLGATSLGTGAGNISNVDGNVTMVSR